MSAKKRNNMRQLALLSFFVVLGAQLGQMVYQQRTEGATLEKRQERLSEVHSGCVILVEEEVEDAIVSGFVTPGGKQGLAVFKKENKGYKLASTEEREEGRTVLATTYLDDEWYQLIWKNAENLEERVRRKQFYTGNGMQPMNVFARVFGVEMESAVWQSMCMILD